MVQDAPAAAAPKLSPSPSTPARTKKSFLFDFAVGGVSAAVAKTSVAPLERVKLILQTQDTIAAIRLGLIPRYTSISDCFKRVVREQGVLSLWRGNLTNCVRYFPTQAFNFALKDSIKHALPKYDRSTHFWRFFAANVASGSLAGAASISIVYPLDLARTLLAADLGAGRKREFTGFVDCISKVTRTSGPASLYQGFFASIQGIVVYRGVYFGLYDTLKTVLFESKQQGAIKGAPRHSPKNDFLKRWLLAQGVTTVASYMAYPFDTVRRRMMMSLRNQPGSVNLPRSTFACWRSIIRNEGPRGLYKGAFSNVLRSSGGALVLVLYDEIERFFLNRASAQATDS